LRLHTIFLVNSSEYTLTYQKGEYKFYTKVANLVAGIVVSTANFIATKIKDEGDK